MITKSNSRKSLALALGIVGVAGLSMASAASLPVASTEIAAGTDTFLDCDADGVTVTYNSPVYTGGTTDAYTVSAVNVADFADGTCAGTVYVTLLDSSGEPLANGTGSVTLAGDDVDVTLAGAVDVSDIYGVAVAVG